MVRPSPVSIRFPPPLRERVAARAAAERRTFSNEVVLLVESALAARTATMLEAERAFLRQIVETFDARQVEP